MSPRTTLEQQAYTIDEFCVTHRICRSKLYETWRNGVGPRVIRIGRKILISQEAAAEWRATREAASPQQSTAA